MCKIWQGQVLCGFEDQSHKLSEIIVLLSVIFLIVFGLDYSRISNALGVLYWFYQVFCLLVKLVVLVGKSQWVYINMQALELFFFVAHWYCSQIMLKSLDSHKLLL